MKWSNDTAILHKTALLAALVGCGAPPSAEDQADETGAGYSVLNDLNYSILLQYDKAALTQGENIKYPVCVTSEFGASYLQRTAMLKIEERAVNRWNEALIGQPQWRVKHIRLYLVGGSDLESCPQKVDGFPVYKLWGINDGRGYAKFWNYINAVERQNFLKPNYRRELHEYGHQLGLGDTYTESGYQRPVNQPQGVMNLYFDVDNLTQDDIASIRAVWRMLRTKSNNPCSTEYEQGNTLENRNKHQFCVKLNGSPSTNSVCTDQNTRCKYWASVGLCQRFPGYMLDKCCASCRR